MMAGRGTRGTARRRTRMRLVIAVAIVTLLVGGCARTKADMHPAALAVQDLLELRVEDVRDVEAYAPYFMPDSSLAEALAGGSGEPTGTPQVPAWEPPYVSEETSSAASVAVVWKADTDFPDWPAVSIILLEYFEDRWVVIDAVEASSAPEPVKR